MNGLLRRAYLGAFDLPVRPEHDSVLQRAILKFRRVKGRPTEMILHQNGRDQTAKRVDDAEFKRIADALPRLRSRAVSWARQGAARRTNMLRRESMIPYTVFSRREQGILLLHY